MPSSNLRFTPCVRSFGPSMSSVSKEKALATQQAEAESARAFFDVMLVYSGGGNDRVESGATWRKSARVAQALLYLGGIALGPVPFLVSRRHACVVLYIARMVTLQSSGRPPQKLVLLGPAKSLSNIV